MEMAMVKMDDKFRVVIPKRLRESIGIFEKASLFAYTFESLIFIRKVESDKAKILESVKKLKVLEGFGNVK
jgi:bifunctional DNA-binding transcriptional regulator/antitoxin component of YhaV-PrlF toxin-antitoxin module